MTMAIGRHAPRTQASRFLLVLQQAGLAAVRAFAETLVKSAAELQLPAGDAADEDDPADEDDAQIVGHVNAVLTTLPAPYRLRTPYLPISLEIWDDDRVVARFPAARLHAYGDSEAEAVEALSEEIAHFMSDAKPYADEGKIGGVVAKQWAAIAALVEVVP